MVQNNQGEFLQPKTITPKIFKYLKKMTDKSAEHEKLVILSFNSFPFSQFVNVNPDRYQYGELLPSHCVVPCIRFIYDRSFHFLGSLFFYREYLERNKAKFSKDMSECIKLYILALANINLKVVATVSPCIQIFIRAIQILAHIPYLEQFDGIISYSVGSNKNIFHIHDPSHIQSELINIFLNYDFHFNLYGVNYLASKNHILESMKLDNRPLISRGPEEESLDQGETIGEYYLSTETSESIRRNIRTEALPAEALGTRLLISMLRGMFHNFYANTEDAKIIMFNEERLQDMAQFIKSIKMIENKTDSALYSQNTGRVDPRKSKMVRNLKDIDSYIDKQNSQKRDTDESAQFKENAKKLEYNIYSEMCNVPDAIQQNPNIVISTASGKTLSADSPTIKKKKKKNASIPPEIRKELIRARIAASEASKVPTPVKEKGKTRNIEALPAKKESPKVSLEASRVSKVSSANKQKSAMNSMELKGKVDSSGQSEGRKDGINEQLETTKQKVTERIKAKSRRRKNSDLNTQQSSMDESNTGQNSEETQIVNTKDIPIPTDQIHHKETDARNEANNKNKFAISKSPSKSIESQIQQTVKDMSEIKRRSPVDLEISEALMMLSGQQMAQQSMAEIREKMEEAKVNPEEFEFDDLPELVEDSDQEIDIIPVSVTEFESSSSEVQDIMAEAKANYEKYFKKDRIYDSDENSKVNLSETKNMEKTKSNDDNKDTANEKIHDSGNNSISTALEKGNVDHTQAKTEDDEVPELVEEAEKESKHETKVSTDKNYPGEDLDSALKFNASEKGNKFDTKTSESGEDPAEASELTLQGKYEILDSIEDLEASNLVGKSRCTISEVDNLKANTSKCVIEMDEVPDLVDDLDCSQDKIIKRSEIKKFRSNLSEIENINNPKTSTTIDIVGLPEMVGDLESTIFSIENNESIEVNLENFRNKSAPIVDSIEQKANITSRVKEQIEDDGVKKPETHEIERKHLSPIQTNDNMISPPSETKKKINLHLDNVKKLEFDDGSDKENLRESRSLNSDNITDVGEQIDTPLRLETNRDFTKSEIPDTDLLEKERNLRIALGVEKSPKQDNTADFQPSDLISKDSMGILVRKYLTRDQIKEILGLDAEVDTESKFDSIIDCLRDTNTQNSEKMKSSKNKPEENLIKISWKDGDTVSIQKVNADSVKPLPKDPFKKSDLSNADNITDLTNSATNKPLKDMNTEESLSDHSTETADSIPDFPDEFDDDASSWGGIVDEQVKLLVESLDDDIKSGSSKSTENENLPVPNEMRKTGAIKKTYERKKKESTLDCDYKSWVNFKKFVNKLCMFLKETSKIYYLPYSPDEYLEKAVEECEKLFAERRNFISTGDGIEVGSFYIKLFCSLLGPDVYRLSEVRTSLQTVIEELDLLAMAENETNSGAEDGFINDKHLLVQNLWIHNVMGIGELFGSLRDYEVLDELAPDLFRTDHVRSIMKHIHKHSNDASTLQINDDCIPLNIRECFDNLKPQGSVLLVE